MRLEVIQQDWRSYGMPQGGHVGRGNHGFMETTQSMQLDDVKVTGSMEQDWRRNGIPPQGGDVGPGNHGLSSGDCPAAERYSQDGTTERYSRNGAQQEADASGYSWPMLYKLCCHTNCHLLPDQLQ